MNFDLFSLPINMMSCFLDGPFVIMFNLGLGLPSLLMIF